MSRALWLWVKTQGRSQDHFSFLSPLSKQSLGNLGLTILCSHLNMPCLLPAPYPVLPRNATQSLKLTGAALGTEESRFTPTEARLHAHLFFLAGIRPLTDC